MKKLIILLTLILGSVSFGLAQDNNDSGFWNDIQIAKSLSKKTDVFVSARVDTKNNASDLSELRVSAGVNRKFGNLSLQGSVVVLKNYGRTSTTYETRPQLIASYTLYKSEKWAITPKHRLEYRFRTGANSVKFVPILTIERKLSKNYKAFQTTEFWLDTRKNDVSQYRKRFFQGINKVMNKNLSIDFFYLYQRDEKQAPRNKHSFGMNWKFKL